ncbi:MAG: VTT domain-containing protein [Candidatus Pacebacteria bacterium]|nr:VTT domain-containing protein [Candidatus Paceibacterota bacterium]
MAEFTIEGLILSVGYFAIFSCMFANGLSGLPSSPLVYLTAGIVILSGGLEWLPTIFLGTLGNVLGNIALYELVRQKGFAWVVKQGWLSQKYMATIAQVRKAFELQGVKIVLIGKFVPMVKVVVPIVAGVAKMHRLMFVMAVSVTSAVWATVSVGYGYYFGRIVNSGDTTWIAGVTLLSIPLVVWWFLRHIQTLQVDR